MDNPAVDVEACRGRQARLLRIMHDRDLEWAVVQSPEHVQWLSGIRFPWFFQSAAALSSAGELVLVAPHRAPELAAADRIPTYDAKWHSTLRNDQRLACLECLRRTVPSLLTARRVGVEFSVWGRHLELPAASLQDVEPDLYRLRRYKDPDELARLRRAIAATEAMYRQAREIIRPGISEIEVFNALQSTAVASCGEMLTGTGNDYQCAARGGAPRADAVARSGDLYILDLGPAYRGYFADNARTIAVDQPTDAQLEAWRFILQALEHVEANARPGKSCRELFDEVQAILDEAPCGKFDHHLGHGIGLFPHEAPHLNPHWDDMFEVGDVFTAEPGLYAPELQAGIRLENDYRVTSDGIERLSPFPLEL